MIKLWVVNFDVKVWCFNFITLCDPWTSLDCGSIRRAHGVAAKIEVIADQNEDQTPIEGHLALKFDTFGARCRSISLVQQQQCLSRLYMTKVI